ncbi:hypothetical protein [Mameliella sp.]|uniref:hypothetical protein n=1 Tax=Mameliella sp. TaxID=1924940 RepID=UPI003B5008CC
MLKRVNGQDGSWPDLISQWEKQCEIYGESLDDFAVASLPVIEGLATGAQQHYAGAYAYSDDGNYKAVCHVNSTFLPKYDGKVLRVRHIVLSPDFDFSDTPTVDDYTDVLVGVFVGAIALTMEEMPSSHVKFHLRSPIERELGEHFTKAISGNAAFKDVAMQGSWIYLSKA